jgi:spermidine synthase
MKRRSSKLLTIESPFPDANCVLRLLEPSDSCHEQLRERVYSGTYDKPFVVDTLRRRFLHFDFGAIQSAMEKSDPTKLALAYTRKMMAFLLFKRDPKRILLLGLGGGSLAKFCYGNLPDAAITAVEVSRDVIALRKHFGIPADNRRFRVINGDGAEYMASTRRRKDVILADACDRKGSAATLASTEFLLCARRRLSSDGVFVANLCGDGASIANQLATIRRAFDNQVLSLQVENDGNIVVFAFKSRPPDMAAERIGQAARELKQRFQLNFPTFARRMTPGR